MQTCYVRAFLELEPRFLKWKESLYMWEILWRGNRDIKKMEERNFALWLLSFLACWKDFIFSSYHYCPHLPVLDWASSGFHCNQQKISNNPNWYHWAIQPHGLRTFKVSVSLVSSKHCWTIWTIQSIKYKIACVPLENPELYT